MSRSTTAVTLWALPAALALSACSHDEVISRPLDQTVCAPAADQSRWAPSGASFSLSASFGSDLQEPLGLVDVWGLTAAPTGLLVYDAGAMRVLELDNDLEPVAQYGREGSGPGEFRYQRINHGDWLTADDSSFYVLQFRGISEFRTGDGFVRLVSGFVNDLPTVGDIVRFDRGLLYASDQIDRGTGTRSLDFWILPLDASDGPETWRTEAMPALPGSAGRHVRGVFVGQAEPQWAASSSCLLVSDGSSPWVVRVPAGPEARADTVPLPDLQPPEPTEEDRQELARLRTRAARMGINVGPEGLEPTAPARWSSMAVDPDGFVWIELWHPIASQDESRRVVVMNPATGEYREIVVPTFPDAFLEDGGFVSLARDPAVGVQVIEKYVPDEASGPG